ncbi:MAG: enoyl-CoA hydratase-related protein [Oscillospiraceae bacterium]|nr:enoyl-CoA hydratase-related protein [Oscillospiraceae bacterium]
MKGMDFIMSNISLEHVASASAWKTAILTIVRPEQLNALNLDTLAEIDAVFNDLLRQKDVRSLIITGYGEKAFVAGADVKQLEGLDRKEAYALSINGNRIFSKLAALPFPVIAAVNGFAFGGGCELALACDIRLASENASFALPEVTLGICPGWGGTQRLARLVGTGHASELLFSAARIKASRAFEIGLVNAVHAQDQLMDSALALASNIGKQAPIAVSAAKKAMYAGIEVSLTEGSDIEAHAFSALFDTTDAKNGLNAFNNKEKYEYTGE